MSMSPGNSEADATRERLGSEVEREIDLEFRVIADRISEAITSISPGLAEAGILPSPTPSGLFSARDRLASLKDELKNLSARLEVQLPILPRKFKKTSRKLEELQRMVDDCLSRYDQLAVILEKKLSQS